MGDRAIIRHDPFSRRSPYVAALRSDSRNILLPPTRSSEFELDACRMTECVVALATTLLTSSDGDDRTAVCIRASKRDNVTGFGIVEHSIPSMFSYQVF
jgi:hypothetical protein